MHKVLIIEDDSDIANLISIHLRDLDAQVEHSSNGKEGFKLACDHHFDLVILDIMLPEMDGLEVCKKLRSLEIQVPILMLTSKSEEVDKVLGLELGADDYLTKPFSIREFIARVKVILRRKVLHRRKGDSLLPQVIHIRDLIIEQEKHLVKVKGTRVDLTPKEYDLLLLLASHPGRIFDRANLLNLIWGYEFSGYEHTVNSHINRLRSKIEPEFAKPTYILTVWGVGYKFNDETD
jgi:two-component system alkaline phosphatase synthesis response regulator PhoP